MKDEAKRIAEELREDARRVEAARTRDVKTIQVTREVTERWRRAANLLDPSPPDPAATGEEPTK